MTVQVVSFSSGYRNCLMMFLGVKDVTIVSYQYQHVACDSRLDHPTGMKQKRVANTQSKTSMNHEKQISH